MKRARSLEDFRRRKPAPPLYHLTLKEQSLLCLWVVLVDGMVFALAWLLSWSWMWEYGRPTLLPPTLATSLGWYVYCARRA